MFSPKQSMLRTAFFKKNAIRRKFYMFQKLQIAIDWGSEVQNALPIAIIWLTKAKYAMHIGLLC